MTLIVKDGDFVTAYKEYYLGQLIAKRRWQREFPQQWLDATGGTEDIVHMGRTCFGGDLFLNGVETEAKLTLLEGLGFDDDAILDIQEAYADKDTDYIRMYFSPHQSFTKEGLIIYLEGLKTVLDDEAIQDITLEIGSFVSEEQLSTPYTPLPSPIVTESAIGDYKYLIYERLNLYSNATTNSDINAALLIFEMLGWLEISYDVFETVIETEVETVVEDEDGEEEIVIVIEYTYRYTTTMTIPLSDTSIYISSSKIDQLFELIYLGDGLEKYYRDWSTGSRSEFMNTAGALWRFESKITYRNDIDDFPAGLLFYYDDELWIDKDAWLSLDPEICMLTLSRLINVRVDASLGFFKGILALIAESMGFIITSLGFISYTILGGFIYEAIATNDVDEEKYRKVAIEVLGNIAFAVLTYGAGGGFSAGAKSLTTLDYILIGLDGVGAGVSGYNTKVEYELEQAYLNNKEIIEVEEKESMMVVYEDRDTDISLADAFYDGIYESMDPYIDMED